MQYSPLQQKAGDPRRLVRVGPGPGMFVWVTGTGGISLGNNIGPNNGVTRSATQVHGRLAGARTAEARLPAHGTGLRGQDTRKSTLRMRRAGVAQAIITTPSSVGQENWLARRRLRRALEPNFNPRPGWTRQGWSMGLDRMPDESRKQLMGGRLRAHAPRGGHMSGESGHQG